MATLDRIRLAGGKREATTGRDIVLHYQPVVSLATGRTEAAEAVIRPRPPRRSERAPSRRLRSGEDEPTPSLGGWALRQAAADAAAWRTDLPVAVTVCPQQLASGALVGQVAAALAESGLPPGRLALHLTQSIAFAADDDAVLSLGALHDRGVAIALGDFGAGSASLATLKRLPLSALKLHPSLVARVPEEIVDTDLLRAAAAAGRALGLRIVATGVESDSQCGVLADAGVHQAQGPFFGRPAPAGALALPRRAPGLAPA